MIADLGRQSAGAPALGLERVGQDVVDRPRRALPDAPRRASRAAPSGTASLGAGCRRCSRARSPAIVRWSRKIVCTRRLSSALTQERVGLRAEHLGPELRQRPVVAGRQHPPARLALLAELLHQDSTGGPSSRNRTTAPRGFVVLGGASTSTRPPCDRWTSTRRPSSSSITTYFPRLVTGRRPRREARTRSRRHRLQRRERSTSAPRSTPAAATSSQSLG